MRVRYLSILVPLFLFADCTSAPPPANPDSFPRETVKNVTSVESSVPPQTQSTPSPTASPPTLAISQSWILKSIKTAYPDGIMSAIIEYSHDSKGQIIRERQKNGSDILTLQKNYTYLFDRIEITILDAEKKIKGKNIQELKKGRLFREQNLNENDEIQSISEYSYDQEGRKIEWMVKGQGSIVTFTQYIWDNNLSKQTLIMDGKKSLIKRYIRSYDSTGKLKTEDEFDSTGSVTRHTILTWDGKLLVREETQSPPGQVLRWTVTSYDSNNLPIKLEFYNRKGELLEIRFQEWAPLEITNTDGK